MEIANTYKVDTAAWKKAARAIRLPYWDWAIHATPPPEVISFKRVTITDMNGTRREVDNPFYSFVFPPNEINDFEGNYREWPATLRRPMSTGAGAQSNVPELIKCAYLILIAGLPAAVRLILLSPQRLKCCC